MTDLKFLLQDGEIFEFKNYSKYSDFIDNLEPEICDLIDVSEHFTKEDFEIAYIEYQKYVKFRNAIENIINKRDFCSKDKLKELSIYDLDNPVLNWLVVKETREDKEIKEMFSLDFFELKDIKKDNKILYYFYDDSSRNKFINACAAGHFEVAKWFLSFVYDEDIEELDEDIKEEGFHMACISGEIEIAMFLYSKISDYLILKRDKTKKTMGIYEFRDETFYWTCAKGQLEIAKWLYSLYDDMFKEIYSCLHITCKKGKLEVAKWLYSLGFVEEYMIEDCFSAVCLNGQVEIAQWLYSLGYIKIHSCKQAYFEIACIRGHLKMAQWFYSFGGIEIHYLNNFAFETVCYAGHLELAQWLWSLGGFNRNGVSTSYPDIKYWLDSLDSQDSCE